jgi:hypothetical protein
VFNLVFECGDKDGEIVVEGTPEELAEHPTSHTGVLQASDEVAFISRVDLIGICFLIVSHLLIEALLTLSGIRNLCSSRIVLCLYMSLLCLGRRNRLNNNI